MDCSPPGFSVHEISQARILEWVAISFSRGSSWPRDQTHIFCFGFFTTDPPAKPRVALWFQKRKSYLFKLVWIGFCLWHVLSHLVPVTTLHSAIMIPILRWANWSPERLSNLSKSHSCGVAGFGSKQSNPGVWNLNKSTALQWEINAENVNMNCMLQFN